ncbi:unnamed protein product [Cryptosporidium hominis]|uniref:Uncharacterized protein n=1 Tax=Cryptosporidium hominis TaxID=237895 RepID=A0A0S4TBJ9_CRYHO|nr:hypothetical protein ChTU502y2012_366g0145 [Cryptosporidium hominis]PPA63455.1 hypothetical protein ChUKH1_07940 [Cryptosporidium hominis]CUV04605.1 unnamed protein product [Cryptosporidium hominis]
MTYLFIYDHLMDPFEFKQCFPNVEFRFFGIGRLDNFKINWIAKGLPFCCRTRPTLMPSLNTATYGVIIEINSYEKKMIREYTKYLPNNLLIETNVVIVKLNFENFGKNSQKNILFSNSGIRESKNQSSFDLKVMTFFTESSNMIFDSTFTDFLLEKQDDFSNYTYLIELSKSSKKISPALPSENYINLITKVAKFYKLPEVYIEENLNLSSKQRLSFFESIVRKIALKYIYLITKFQIQGIGVGIIDLLWELDPQDPLVFADYGKINKGIVFLIATFIIMLLSPILCFIAFFWK